MHQPVTYIWAGDGDQLARVPLPFTVTVQPFCSPSTETLIEKVWPWEIREVSPGQACPQASWGPHITPSGKAAPWARGVPALCHHTLGLAPCPIPGPRCHCGHLCGLCGGSAWRQGGSLLTSPRQTHSR